MRARFSLPLLLLVSLALNWPYLAAGFTPDDMWLVQRASEQPPSFSRWLGLWSWAGETVDSLSAMGDPWWADPGALAGGGFFRPLPSLIIEASVTLFGRTAFPLHLFSILLHGLVGFIVFVVFHRLGLTRLTALVCGLVFIACDDHSMGVGFISLVTDILCVFFITLSLLLHLVWLQKRSYWALSAAMLATLAALCCKETAAIAPVALVLTTFYFPCGTVASASTSRPGSLRARMAAFVRDPLSWAPGAVLLVLYLVCYQSLNLGGMNNLSYIDPLAAPGRYLAHLSIHLPVMWLATLSPVSPSIGMFKPEAMLPMAVAGLVLFVLLVLALWPRRHEPIVRWGLLLYLLSLLPQLSTDASERLLYFPFVFAGMLITLLVQRIPLLARRVFACPPATTRLARVLGWILLAGCVLCGAGLSAVTPFVARKMAARMVGDPLTALPHMRQSSARHFIMLNSRNAMSGFFHKFVLDFHEVHSWDVRVLSACRGRMSLERWSDSSFVLRTNKKGWLSNYFAKMLRTDPKLEPGAVYRNSLFDATLLELTEDGSDVLAVRFDMHRPLSDPSVLFLAWNGRAYEPTDIAALARGERVRLRL